MVATIATAASAAYYMQSQQSYRHPNQYYIAGKEPDGLWWNPTGLFGLEDGGKVDPRHFHRLYNGFSPADMSHLTRNAGSDKRSPGMDLTFSADKSVSALWAVADADTRAAIEAAQQEAARFALDFIIRGHCAHTRIRHPDGELAVVPADILAATFQHGSSRANDPQLHTHCLIFNVARAHHDGEFRALHGRPLFRWKKAAGAVYRSALAWNLQQKIGVQMQQYGREREFTRVDGIPQELVKAWSKRRGEIEGFAAVVGFETSENAARAAALNKLTRNAKDTDCDAARQFNRWQVEANGIVADLKQTLADVLGREIDIDQEQIRSLTDALDRLPEKLTVQEAVVALPHVVEKIANTSASLSAPQALETHVERVLSSSEMIRLDISETSADAAAWLGHTRLYTTRSTLERETEVRDLAARTKVDPRHGIAAQTIEAKLAELRDKGYHLSPEQIAGIRHATAAGRTAIIEGAAGSGKTTTLRPIADLYREAGYTVLGTAVPWRITTTLGNDCDIDHFCIKSLLNRAAKGSLALDDKTVVIVDEAGMLCTSQVLSLLKLSEAHGAKIIWAGDTRQQQPVDAGPGLRLIRDITKSLRVDPIRRQQADIEDVLVHHHGQSQQTARLQAAMMDVGERDRLVAEFENLTPDVRPAFTPWMVTASEAFRDYRMDDAIAAYRERGRFHVCRTIQDTATQLVEDWDRYRQENPHKTSIVLTQSRKEATALSHLLRDRLHAEKQDSETAVIHACRGREGENRATPLEIRRGDRLRIGATNWDHHLFNGTIVTVEDFRVQRALVGDGSRVLITGRTEYGRKVSFHHDDIKDRHGHVRLDYGFAITFTAAQGLTVDQSFVYADTHAGAESMYAAATRHREGLDIYVNRRLAEPEVLDARADSDRDQSVTDDEIVAHLAARWSHSQPKVAAYDHISDPLLKETLDRSRRPDQAASSDNSDRADPAAWLAANDNGDGMFRAAARGIRHAALDLRYGQAVAAVATARADVLASYDDLRAQTRQQGIAVAAGDAFAETLARHGRVLQQAEQFRKNPERFAALLARRGGINANDLNEFAELHKRARAYQRRALAKQNLVQKAAQETAERKERAGESAPQTATAEAVVEVAETTRRATTQTQGQRFPRAADLSAQLALRAEDVCRHYLPQGTKNGRFWQVGNTAGDPGQSLFVHLTGRSQGKWRDAATNESGDMLDLIQATGRFQKMTEAMDEARHFLGDQATLTPQVAQRQQTAAGGDEDGRARRLYDRARPITANDPAARYLENRGLSSDDAPDLRFIPTAMVKLGEEIRKMPAMVVPIRALDGRIEAVQRIFLSADGHQADILEPKRYTASPGAGAVWFGNPKVEKVALCEGVEDALAVMRVLSADEKQGLAIVSSAGAGRAAAVDLPEHVSHLTLIQDRDQAGERSWTALQAKYKDSAIELQRILPTGKDANEDLLRHGPDALRKTLAPLTQDLDRKKAETQQAQATYKQLIADWKKHEGTARKAGLHPTEHQGYGALRARMDALHAANTLDEKSQQLLGRAQAWADRAIAERQSARVTCDELVRECNARLKTALDAHHDGFDDLSARMHALHDSGKLDPRRQRTLAYAAQVLDREIDKRLQGQQAYDQMFVDWRAHMASAHDAREHKTEHPGYDELHSRMRALRSSLTLDPQRQQGLTAMLESLDWEMAKREEAEQACEQLLDDWREHERNARKAGVHPSEHAGCNELELRTKRISVSLHLPSGARRALTEKLDKLDQAEDERQRPGQTAVRQTSPPDPERLQQIDDHLKAVAALGRTHDRLEKAAECLGLQLALCEGYAQWDLDTTQALSQTETMLRDPAFARERNHRDTGLRLTQCADQLRERRHDAYKLILQGSEEHKHQEQADQAAVTPEQRQAREGYRELMRDLDRHQRHTGKHGWDPIRHQDYHSRIRQPTQALIDNPHLDEHTRDQLKERLERQMVHVKEWQREYQQHEEKERLTQRHRHSIRPD